MAMGAVLPKPDCNRAVLERFALAPTRSTSVRHGRPHFLPGEFVHAGVTIEWFRPSNGNRGRRATARQAGDRKRALSRNVARCRSPP